MERFVFNPEYAISSELENRLAHHEADGKPHREALENLVAEIRAELMTLKPDAANEYRINALYSFNSQLEKHAKKLKWMETHNYEPRMHKQDFVFEDIMDRAKRKGSISRQIQYLEEIVLEYRTFCEKFKPNSFQYGFGERVEAEITELKLELELAKKPESEKLVWRWKVAEFGHLFSELFNLQYLGFADGEEINYSRLARICLELFEFEGKPSKEYLANQLNPEKNALSDNSRKRFKIPDLKELNPRKAKNRKQD
jgi:hypothetical protein